jgi:hypothetical protein
MKYFSHYGYIINKNNVFVNTNVKYFSYEIVFILVLTYKKNHYTIKNIKDVIECPKLENL